MSHDPCRSKPPSVRSVTTPGSRYRRDVIDQLASGKSPAVVVNVNGYEYRNTVGVRSGTFLISLSAAVRKATGLKGGDPIAVTLTLAEGPRPVDMSEDFGSALDANPEARAFFDGLSNSLQRYHCDNINGAKTDDTRQRRIAKAVDLFLAGKQR